MYSTRRTNIKKNLSKRYTHFDQTKSFGRNWKGWDKLRGKWSCVSSWTWITWPQGIPFGCPYGTLNFGKRRLSRIWPKDNIVVYCMNFAKRCLNCHLPFESCLKFTLGYKPLELLFVSSSRWAPDSPMLDKITKYYFFQTLLIHLNLILYFPYSDVHCINIQLCLIFNT